MITLKIAKSKYSYFTDIDNFYAYFLFIYFFLLF